jgi:hypothetical protein
MQVMAHRGHFVDEGFDWFAQRIGLQVGEDLMPVGDGSHIVQWWVEELVETSMG